MPTLTLGLPEQEKAADVIAAPRSPDFTTRARTVIQSAAAFRNLRLMSVLTRIAARFDSEGVPLMALKGAALNLILYDRPDSRPMADLDLMVAPSELDATLELLAGLGGVRPPPDGKREFFPRFHYETELRFGTIYPIKIDLHIRPLRPLRFSATVPPRAFWDEAEAVEIGDSAILIPGPADMLLHLLAHSAVHGNTRQLWLEDVRLWIARQGHRIDWETLLARAEAWRLSLAVQQALQAVESTGGPIVPDEPRSALSAARVNWRDRLTLWQAPRDARRPIAHVLVNAITTPGVRFAAAYLMAAFFPSAKQVSVSLKSCVEGATRNHAKFRGRPVAPNMGESCLDTGTRQPAMGGGARPTTVGCPILAAGEGGGSMIGRAEPPAHHRDPAHRCTMDGPPLATPAMAGGARPTKQARPATQLTGRVPRWTDRLGEFRPIRRPGVRTYSLDTEGVFVDAVCGNVHQLNATAKHIWHMCDGDNSLGEIATVLADRFDVAPDAAMDHVEQVLAALGEANLLGDEVST